MRRSIFGSNWLKSWKYKGQRRILKGNRKGKLRELLRKTT